MNVSKIQNSLVIDTQNIYMNGTRFCWSFEFINEAYRKNILESEAYKKLPRYAQNFVDGARHVLDRQLWANVVYSYEINGKRLTIDSKPYRRVSPQRVHKLWSHTGCFVYKSDPTKLFTNPEKKE